MPQHAEHGFGDEGSVSLTQRMVLPEVLAEDRVSRLFELQSDTKRLRRGVEKFAVYIQK
ncbi:MAG: hypothetical protein ACXWC5_18910 [Burkholderiales bacterium]